jgi:hypothetical protein
MSLSTIIPSNVITKGVLRESYIDNASIATLQTAGINPAVIPSCMKSIKLIIFNRTFHGVGVCNQNGGVEFFSPQLNIFLEERPKNNPTLFATFQPEAPRRPVSKALPTPDKEVEKLLSQLKEETATGIDEHNSPVTLKYPGLCHFPKSKASRTRECCLFVDFLSFLGYQSRLRQLQDPDMVDCDCLVMNNPCNFLDFIIDSENYEKPYCVFPKDDVGATLLRTLKSRRETCVVDFSRFHFPTPRIEDLTSCQNRSNLNVIY